MLKLCFPAVVCCLLSFFLLPSFDLARQAFGAAPSAAASRSEYFPGTFPGDPSGRLSIPLPQQKKEKSRQGVRLDGAPLRSLRDKAPVAALRFDRVIHACLYRNNLWLLPGQQEYPVGQALASLAPTFVTGAMSVTAGVLPDSRTIRHWAGLRRAVRKQAAGAAFDIVLDLRQYGRAHEVTAAMARIGAQLEAESWSLLGVSAAASDRPGLLAAAVAEAHRQGRKVGGFVEEGRGESFGLDYIFVPYEHDGPLPPTPASGPQVIMLASSAAGPPGKGFARGIAPAARRLMVLRAAGAQKNGLSFAYPVFGPMSGQNQAYNALRDEFMLDTVRRCLRSRGAGRTGAVSE
jgi:hypothetical protein